MSEAPERIWVQTDHISDHLALDRWHVKPDAEEAGRFTEYVRADHNAALVAAAYQAAGDAVNEADSLELATKGTGDIDARIRALTPADAQAALDALIQKAVAEERERCARVALAYHDRHARGYGAVGNSPDEKAHHTHGEVIAAAIREGNA